MTAKIKLNAASGGGSFSLQAPSSSSNNRVMTLPDSADGTVLTTTNPKAGNIIQVLQTVKTDTFSLGGVATADITGLSQAITPSSTSNKILVSYTVNFAIKDGGFATCLKLLRGSTQIFLGDAASNRGRYSNAFTSENGADFGAYEYHIWTGSFLDSPNSTSATTYKLQLYSNNSGRTAYINRSHTDADSATGGFRTASQITVEEVAV
nr:hypothetical protein MedDCM-OCT-S15-C1-cds24 [uncultured Mediterranean phage MEDS1 group]BAR22032.1 hypothetical protein [uncultured Mediterranean phage uvMED]BAR22080.1 hypothetical protein [uncultured Mediterranean phage uvMED]BAR22135.1 hypothetical protein [uncultured Mediterranean phage uvMED]BAR39045.1 hypothetical protein [uncultured Mediterranean phage uvMED]